MCDAVFGLEDLRACLAAVAPVELKGMGLLAQQPRLVTGTARIPRGTLVEAVTEIVAYTDRSAKAAQQLAKLTPVPLTEFSILEYGI